MEIAQRLRKRRQELGLTQEHVAREAGMNVTQYNGYERGRSAPSTVTLPRLAKALDTSTDELLRRNPERLNPSSADSETLRSLISQFRDQVAFKLDLEPEDVTVRVEVHPS